MSLFNRNNPNSRFQVTPRDDIEAAHSLVQRQNSGGNGTGINAATSDVPTSAAVGAGSTNANALVDSGSSSPAEDPYLGVNYFTINENDISEKNMNTYTSYASFYNTIYTTKYNRLNSKQNSNTSMETMIFPIRKMSTAPHHIIGISYYNERVRVYNFLQRPAGYVAVGYHVCVSIAVIYCLVLTILSTTQKYVSVVSKWLNLFDFLIILFFVFEFFARIWASECVSFYRGWRGKIRFFRNPIRILDLVVIVISLIVLVTNAKGELLITSLRGVRFLQIFQMVRLDYKFRPWRMMASVVYSQRIHLAIVCYMGFLSLIFISFVIYFVEKDDNEDFDSLASSMWWAVVTLCTIGYGDMYPKTSTGKFLACVCSIIGVSIFALPAGILGTGLALKVQEQQRQLKMSKRKQPAARVIQAAWRCYVSGRELQEPPIKYTLALKDGTKPYESVLWKRFENGKNKQRILTRKEIKAIHFVFTVKLWIARRDFVKAFKPYDIKDVLEQYAAGHADMLAKIRIMDHRLERIQSNHVFTRANTDIREFYTNRLAKLESDIQNMQANFSELIDQQINSRVTIQTFMKFVIDQQQTLILNNNNCVQSKQSCCDHAKSGDKDEASKLGSNTKLQKNGQLTKNERHRRLSF